MRKVMRELVLPRLKEAHAALRAATTSTDLLVKGSRIEQFTE